MAGDVLVLAIAGCLAVAAETAGSPSFRLDHPELWWSSQGAKQAVMHVGMTLATVIVFFFSRHYVQRRPFWDELPSIATIILAMGCIEATAILLAGVPMSRYSFLVTWLAAIVLVPASRRTIKGLMIRMGGWVRPTVIVGCTEGGRDIARALMADPVLGYYVTAFLVPRHPQGRGGERDEPQPARPYVDVDGIRIPAYRCGEPIDAELVRLGRPHVILALDADDMDRWTRELLRRRHLLSSLSVVSPLKGLPLVDTAVAHFFRHDVMLLTVPNNLGRKNAQRLKRLFDVAVAVVAIVILSPLLAWIYVMISREGGSAIFSHPRIGQGGRRFHCHKFRTMLPHTDQVLRLALTQNPELQREWSASQKLRHDPRVTEFGQFLRRTSLDELPQLWNVIKGEMSLVGPRPIVEAEIERYGADSSYYLQTRPGITGLWQISGRSSTAYERRVALDIWYAKNWSLWYDVVIILKTVTEVIGRRGAY